MKKIWENISSFTYGKYSQTIDCTAIMQYNPICLVGKPNIIFVNGKDIQQIAKKKAKLQEKKRPISRKDF